jgi:hypothetical protein
MESVTAYTKSLIQTILEDKKHETVESVFILPGSDLLQVLATMSLVEQLEKINKQLISLTTEIKFSPLFPR